MATLGLSPAEREAIEAFRRDVIEPSMTSLVILDFWAEWCGPCKQLTPVLEKVAADYAAKGVKLVKVDVDENKIVAAQFRIQSIPTVYAVFQGQPVADMTQARTESQVKRLLDQILAQLPIQSEEQQEDADINPLIETAETLLTDGDVERAMSIFSQLRNIAPEHPAIISGLIRTMIAAGQASEAGQLLENLPESVVKDPAIARARSALELTQAAPTGELAEFEQRIAADPDDLQARFDLAGALLAKGDRDAGADQLLEIIRRDRDWNDAAARKKLLQAIEAVGLEDPWASQQRRRLSAILFT